MYLTKYNIQYLFSPNMESISFKEILENLTTWILACLN